MACISVWDVQVVWAIFFCKLCPYHKVLNVCVKDCRQNDTCAYFHDVDYSISWTCLASWVLTTTRIFDQTWCYAGLVHIIASL